MSDTDNTAHYDEAAHFEGELSARLARRLGAAIFDFETAALRAEFEARKAANWQREAADTGRRMADIEAEVAALAAGIGAGGQGMTAADAPLGEGGDVGSLEPLEPPVAEPPYTGDVEVPAPLPPPTRRR